MKSPIHSYDHIRTVPCRARGLLGWSQAKLAGVAGVEIVTVRQLEAGVHTPRRATMEVIQRALEEAGVEFIVQTGAAQACDFEGINSNFEQGRSRST